MLPPLLGRPIEGTVVLKLLQGMLFAILFAVGINDARSDVGLPEIYICDGCTDQQKLTMARERSGGLGLELIGDRQNGVVKAWLVNFIDRDGGIPVGIHPADHMVSQKVKTQFALYSEVYRERQNVSPINITLFARPAGSSLPAAFPDSAFDVTEDGAARYSLISWAKDSNNWGWGNIVDRARLYAKTVVNEGRAWYSGTDYMITMTFSFNDGSSVMLRYNSITQTLEFVEARDSVGNLLATNSDEAIPVDYSWYERPEAKRQADYTRGVGWLNARGLISGGGSIVRGTVIVGGTVQIRDK